MEKFEARLKRIEKQKSATEDDNDSLQDILADMKDLMS